MRRFLTGLLVVGVATLGCVGQARLAPAPSSPEVEFFEKRIRPVLVEHCYDCHSAQSEKLRAGLRLDSREGLLKGGESGPAAVPGDPESSLLIKAVRYRDKDMQMPPRKGKLPDSRIDDLVHWIRMGMPWSSESKASHSPPPRAFEITEQDRAYWAFQPIHRPTLPPVRQQAWVANGIDAFVLAGLEAKDIAPNAPATRRELIRRLYFDLLGVPPSPAEVASFVNDVRQDSYEQLVDRLLSRPEYGERWARHWLDAVRYAQSNGYERDGEKPLAWRYRDYVIQALNDDKPYNRFVQEQIAGDELPDATAESVIATGFQRLGVWDDEPDDKTMAEFDGLDDIVSTTSAAFLGLTLGCARCHDHKFDPISQADYYHFLAFFRNLSPNENARYALDSPNYLPLAAPNQVAEWVQERQARSQMLESRLACEIEGPAKAALQTKLQQVRDENWPFEWALGVREQGAKPIPTHVLIRGNPNAPGPEVEPSFLSVLGGQRPVVAPAARGTGSTGRRLVLANWIASAENPLTARVAVNRVWHHHFGQGIVKTTADFGRAGTPPTHPELLSWLASEFIDSGWSLKRLHRLILLSNTYRMSSRSDNAKALATDPADDLLWRQHLRRLEAESVWDTMLSVSGELNPKMGGRGFFPHLDAEVLAGESRPGADWEISTPPEQARRSIYTYIRRTMLVPLLEAFDYNNTSSPLAERPVTTVAPQALMLLNAGWTQQRAEAFAERLAREAGADPRDRVRLAYQLALARAPQPSEMQVALEFLNRLSADGHSIRPGLTFRPEVPNSLFSDYLKQLQSSDYLSGPHQGWTYYRGRWSGAYEGIRTVDRPRGPFALWNGQVFEDGLVEASLLLHPASEFGSLLLRATAEGDEQRGYEVVFDPRQQRVILRRHTRDINILGQAATTIPMAQPFLVRIELAGARLQIWLNPAPAGHGRQADPVTPGFEAGWSATDQPVLAVTDPKPIVGKGWLGVRTSGAALSLEDLTLRALTGTTETAVDTNGSSVLSQVKPGANGQNEPGLERRVWRSFCLLLLNLNEFVYVD